MMNETRAKAWAQIQISQALVSFGVDQAVADTEALALLDRLKPAPAPKPCSHPYGRRENGIWTCLVCRHAIEWAPRPGAKAR